MFGRMTPAVIHFSASFCAFQSSDVMTPIAAGQDLLVAEDLASWARTAHAVGRPEDLGRSPARITGSFLAAASWAA